MITPLCGGGLSRSFGRISNGYVEEVPDAEELIKKIVQAEWDVVISDLSMPGRSGLEALQQIKQIQPKLPVLILSIHPEDQYAIRVLKAGAAGYLSKDMAPDELVNAVQRVMLGKKYITAFHRRKTGVGAGPGFQ